MDRKGNGNEERKKQARNVPIGGYNDGADSAHDGGVYVLILFFLLFDELGDQKKLPHLPF